MTLNDELLPFDESIGYQIRTTHRLFQNYLQSRIEPHGITLGMWYFLRVLWEEEGLTQRELSDIVGTMEPTTLIAMRSMEKSGLIHRKRNLEDGRKINIFLTEKGRNLKPLLLPLAKDVVDKASSLLPPKDKAELFRLLKSIQVSLKKIQ